MSKILNCKSCGKEIAKGVNKCVHCGKDQRNFFMKHKILTFILVVVMLAGISSALNGDKEETKETGTTPVATDTTKKDTSKAEEKKEESKVNYENFLKIKMDSKYEDVVALIGEGKELTSSEISGIKTVMYTWNGSGFSNMNVTIQNGIVTGKASLDLSNVDAKVTLEKYNKIKDGMSYAEVKAILGEGELMSQTKIMDMESTMYTWVNKGGSNMNCTFSGDNMMMKAQFNLK